MANATAMVQSYFPLLLLFGFVALNAVLILGISAVTLRSRPTPVKSQAYESGMSPLGDAR